MKGPGGEHASLLSVNQGYHLESMQELLEALFYGYERHRPLLITDTS